MIKIRMSINDPQHLFICLFKNVIEPLPLFALSGNYALCRQLSGLTPRHVGYVIQLVIQHRLYHTSWAYVYIFVSKLCVEK